MGGGRTPGPVCSTRVKDDWIDDGTLCRDKSAKPGVVDTTNATKNTFDKAHGYSLAPEARRKRAIDLEIIGNDYSRSGEVSIDSETYLKKLIKVASDGKQKVDDKSHTMQFFIVQGGAEGFLPDKPEDLSKIDARNHVTKWKDTDLTEGETDFDENDLLAVFNTDGTLIASARLSRPTYVQGQISSKTANRVYEAWNGKTVFIYKSNVPGWIPYLGLALDDGFRDGSANKGHKVFIDLHKQEQTNGCIFIIDPSLTGATDLRTFEPELIKKVMKAKGIDEAKVAKGQVTLGKMHMIKIKL